MTSFEDPVTDTISLTIPASASYHSVAALVLGGIGSRLDLPYEKMDDLQLAVLSVLAGCSGVVTIEVEADEGGVAVTIGPLLDVGADDPALRRVVTRLVDSVEGSRRDGQDWLSLRLRRTRAELV